MADAMDAMADAMSHYNTLRFVISLPLYNLYIIFRHTYISYIGGPDQLLCICVSNGGFMFANANSGGCLGTGFSHPKRSPERVESHQCAKQQGLLCILEQPPLGRWAAGSRWFSSDMLGTGGHGGKTPLIFSVATSQGAGRARSINCLASFG